MQYAVPFPRRQPQQFAAQSLDLLFESPLFAHESGELIAIWLLFLRVGPLQPFVILPNLQPQILLLITQSRQLLLRGTELS